MVYSLYILTEALALSVGGLCAWLMVEALARSARGASIAAAVAVALSRPSSAASSSSSRSRSAPPPSCSGGKPLRAARLRGRSWARADTIGLALLGFGLSWSLTAAPPLADSEWRIATDLITHLR